MTEQDCCLSKWLSRLTVETVVDGQDTHLEETLFGGDTRGIH